MALQKTNLIPMKGKKYNKLTVLKRVDPIYLDEPAYLCKCECGNKKVIKGAYLRQNRTKSCGCYRREVYKKIGQMHTIHYYFFKGKIYSTAGLATVIPIKHGTKAACRLDKSTHIVDPKLRKQVQYLHKHVAIKALKENPKLWWKN